MQFLFLILLSTIVSVASVTSQSTTTNLFSSIAKIQNSQIDVKHDRKEDFAKILHFGDKTIGFRPKTTVLAAASSSPRDTTLNQNKKLMNEKGGETIRANIITSTFIKLLSFVVSKIQTATVQKFAAFSLMNFWIIFVFTITRDTKETLIVTSCGAEAIAFLKVYGVIPAATAFMFLYSRLASKFSPQHLFYIILAPFFIFYTIFAFFLYPLRDHLHPSWLSTEVSALSFIFKILQNWTFSLYYIVSELWSSAGIPLLFWSCANDVIPLSEAKKTYPYMSLIGNSAPIIAGLVTQKLAQVALKMAKNNDDHAFELSLKANSIFLSMAGVIIAVLHAWIYRIANSEKSTLPPVVASTKKQPLKPTTTNVKPIEKKEKGPKPTLWASLKLLSSNPYLRHIAVMVLSYGVAIEFTEITWKSVVKSALPEKTEYLAFMGRYSQLVGASSYFMLVVGSLVLGKVGYRAAALMTPVIMGLVALPFFASITLGDLRNKKTLLIAVYVGLVQHMLSKAAKYSIFDPTKEIAYIPLDVDSRTKGKAAIDVLGARLGKSAGALVQQSVILMTGSLLGGARFVAVLFYAVIAAWIDAVTRLAPLCEEKLSSSSAPSTTSEKKTEKKR